MLVLLTLQATIQTKIYLHILLKKILIRADFDWICTSLKYFCDPSIRWRAVRFLTHFSPVSHFYTL